MLKYDKLFKLLKEKGITTTQIRRDKIMGQKTYYDLKSGKGNLNHQTVDSLCRILGCQPGDLMEYVDEQSKADTED